jgi:hypothetical protein
MGEKDHLFVTYKDKVSGVFTQLKDKEIKIESLTR